MPSPTPSPWNSQSSKSKAELLQENKALKTKLSKLSRALDVSKPKEKERVDKGARRKERPQRKTRQGGHRAAAMKKYTLEQATVKEDNRCRDAKRNRKAVLEDREAQGNVLRAVEVLREQGFLGASRWCLRCNGRKLSKIIMRKRSGDRRCYVRCLNSACQARNNVLDYSVFRGTRFSPGELKEAIDTYYKTSSIMRGPRVTDICSSTGFGRCQIEHLHTTLQAVECDAAREFCSNFEARGDLEADAALVKKIWVSNRNPNFQQTIKEAKDRFLGAKPSQQKRAEAAKMPWRVHVRVIGMCER